MDFDVEVMSCFCVGVVAVGVGLEVVDLVKIY